MDIIQLPILEKVKGPVHMHQVSCNGTEPSLLNCTYETLSLNIINPHVADAGVRCFNTTGIISS